jgi:plastocyanin
MRVPTLLALALAAVLGPAAGGAAAPGAAVEVRVFQFRPAVLEIERGTTVTWTTQDEIRHTVTAGTPEAPLPAGFDLALDDKGARASAEFRTPGSYPYFCRRHNAMRGEIRVK